MLLSLSIYQAWPADRQCTRSGGEKKGKKRLSSLLSTPRFASSPITAIPHSCKHFRSSELVIHYQSLRCAPNFRKVNKKSICKQNRNETARQITKPFIPNGSCIEQNQSKAKYILQNGGTKPRCMRKVNENR